jgi:hypothetical protein
MGRVIKYWIGLGTIAAVTTYGGMFLIFQHIDLTFLQFAALLCAPLFQAVVVTWRQNRPAEATTALARSVAGHPLASPVLVLDAVLLGAGIIWWDARLIGLGAAVGVQSTWTVAKAVVATAFLSRVMLRASGRDRLTMLMAVVPPLALVFALDPSTSWLAAGFPWARDFLPSGSEVVQRLVYYGVLILTLLVLTLRGARVLGATFPDAAALLQVTVAGALVVAVMVILATFNLPVVVQPWLGVAMFGASVAASSVLLAAIVAAVPRD